MKRVICILLALMLVLSLGINALAAPASLSSAAKGNAVNLITVKKPQTSISDTTKKNYAISAVGATGTEAAVYKWNESAYVLAGSEKIGASGIFVRQLSLSTGTNRIAVWAGRGDKTQVVHLVIRLADQGILNKIINYKINIQSVLKGWV